MSKLEYLNPSDWSLHVIDGDSECVPDGWVLVPEGAEFYRVNGKFYRKINQTLLFFSYCGWIKSSGGYCVPVLWQRNPSLNDQYVEIEKVRQGSSKGVLDRADIFCKETSRHHHYFKNVENLNMIDVYRVLELFDVKSHAVGHAIKKLLCSGGRGSKNYLQDVQEAIESLQREIEMKKEDCK